jgi:DNA-directed RNA polymerase specialized sigma24 family protein
MAEVIATRTEGRGIRPPGKGRIHTSDSGSDPDLWLYRDRTVAMLKRYLRLSIEVGRLPSLLGREFFRTRVTSYHVSTFEDAVVFVHDVERSLERLDQLDQELIAKIVLEEYSQEETAHLLGCWRRTVGRRYPEALDELSKIFLTGGLLSRLVQAEEHCRESCQEGDNEEIRVSDWDDAE